MYPLGQEVLAGLGEGALPYEFLDRATEFLVPCPLCQVRCVLRAEHPPPGDYFPRFGEDPESGEVRRAQ
jgi:hypothetical protein